MGKLKKEMKKIHAKRIRKAKEQLKSYREGKLSYEQLNKLAKKFLRRAQNKNNKET